MSNKGLNEWKKWDMVGLSNGGMLAPALVHTLIGHEVTTQKFYFIFRNVQAGVICLVRSWCLFCFFPL